MPGSKESRRLAQQHRRELARLIPEEVQKPHSLLLGQRG